MPQTQFICPDGQTIHTADCVIGCRMKERCVSKPTILLLLNGIRTWKGQPSTTQLLNGTRLEYLKWKHNFASSPQSSAFSLLGTIHHAQMAMPGQLAEQQLGDDDSLVSGVADLLMPDEHNPGSHIILDYKTYGSYRVAKLLGITYRNEFSTTEVYQRSGAWGKVGTPKKIKTFYEDPTLIDNFDESMQLNHYRVLAERKGYTISGMELQITVRDGGLQIARERGVDKNIYYPVHLPFLPNADIEAFYQAKAESLIYAISNDIEPSEECTDKEAWDGLRCKRFCDVAEFCSRGIRENNIT